jgi:hypothetical protein
MVQKYEKLKSGTTALLVFLGQKFLPMDGRPCHKNFRTFSSETVTVAPLLSIDTKCKGLLSKVAYCVV